MKRSLRERLRMRKRAYVPNTFIGGIAKLGGTGANVPILTAAELATTLGISESIIKGFWVVGEDVECHISVGFGLPGYSFQENKNITTFNSIMVTSIGSRAFNRCSSLTSVNFPIATTIFSQSFFNCTSLTSVNFPMVTTIGEIAFSSCTSLTSINFPMVTTIGGIGSFSSCTSLTSVNLPLSKFLGNNTNNNNVFVDIALNATINTNIFLKTANAGALEGDLLYAYSSRNATINFYDDDGIFVETYNPQPDLYTQNDACSIGVNETESIGVGWTYDGIINQEVVSSSISEFAIKFTLPANDYSHCLLQLTGLEVGETYLISFSVRCYADDGVTDGGGFFRATTDNGWSSMRYADFNSVNWTEKSFEASASVSNPVLELYPAWLGDDPQAGWFAIIDNISIKKTSDSPIEPEETIMSFVDYNPPTPLPEYLEPFIEENFGNKVTRISSIAEFGGVNRYLVHNYSKRQVWNSDQTLLNLGDGRLLDGNTYELLGPYETGNMGWSNTNPYRSYETTSSTNYFRTYYINPETFALTTVSTRNFSAYNVMSHWTAETNISADDKYVVLYGHRISTGTDTWVLVYNREDDEIVSETNLGTPRSNIDWVSMSQSGNFVVVLYNSNGSGTHQGTKAYNRNMVLQKHLTNTTQHGDLGYDQNGNEVWVFYDMGYLKSTTLSGSGGIIQYAYMQGGHVSCRNLNRPGWAYISDNGDANIPSDYPAFREVFAVKLDEKITGKTIVNRFTKHYTKTNDDYEHYAMACASPDGTKVIFKSNMTNATVESQTYPFAWVVEADD